VSRSERIWIERPNDWPDFVVIDDIGGDILGHDGSRRDNASSPDPHSSQYRCPKPDPNVVFNNDWRRKDAGKIGWILRMAGGHYLLEVPGPLVGISRMAGAVVDIHIVRNQNPLPDSNAVHRPDFGSMSHVTRISNLDLSSVCKGHKPATQRGSMSNLNIRRIAARILDHAFRIDCRRRLDCGDSRQRLRSPICGQVTVQPRNEPGPNRVRQRSQQLFEFPCGVGRRGV